MYVSYKSLVAILALVTLNACTANYAKHQFQNIVSTAGLGQSSNTSRTQVVVFQPDMAFYVAYPEAVHEDLDVSSRYYYQLYQELKRSFAKEFPNSRHERPSEVSDANFYKARQLGVPIVVRPRLFHLDERVNSVKQWRQRLETDRKEKLGFDRLALSLEIYDSQSEKLIDRVFINTRSSIFTSASGDIDNLWSKALAQALMSIRSS